MPQQSLRQSLDVENFRAISARDSVPEVDDLDVVWSSEPDSNDLASDLNVGDHFAVYVDPLDPNARGAKFLC